MMDIDDENMDSQATDVLSSQVPVLEFSESLIGVPKARKVGELLELLKTLHTQLKEMDQNVDQESLATVTKELIHKQILKNTNKSVKAVAACCLADIIRLHAPTCPYTIDQLKDIFTFFINQLSYFGIGSPDFEYHFYLLENLQSVKTFLLLNEIENADELVLPMIDDFFKVTEKATLARNVELCMTDVLIQLIEDVGILGPEITECILEQFEKNNKGSTNPAYLMALDICYACPNILQRRVCQYFSDALLSVSGSSENSTEEFEDVKKSHTLIRKINAITPDLLFNVLPLLQEEMKVDQLNVRQLATETMGQMFAEQSSNVAEKYPAIWKTWLGRRNDKAIQLRVRWLEMCVDIYKNHHEAVPELIDCFKDKLADPDDKVRSIACKVLGEIGMESNLKTLDKALLQSISDRTKDKKSTVRTEAINTIGSIYQNCYARILAGEKIAIEKVGWIPDSLLSRLYVGDLSVTMSLESSLQKFIFPENSDDEERTERLVTVIDSLPEKQRLAFTALVRKQKAFNEHMQKYVKMCENHMDNNNMNEHEIGKADEFMKYMAGHFPDKARTLNALRSFMNRESDKDVKLLKTCIDLDRDYKRVCIAKNKLLSNLNDDQSAILDIFQALLNRSCPLILNKSNVTHLLKMSKTARGRRHTVSSQRATVAQDLSKEISTTYPTMYSANMKDVLQEIMDDNDSSADEGLELLAEISKASSGKMTYKADIKERLMTYVASGSVSQAEYAAIALGNMKNAEVVLADLASNLCDELLLDASNLLTNLGSLSQFALYSSDVITPSINSIIRFIESDLLQEPTKVAESNKDWLSFEELPELSQQKLVAIRLLINYLTASKEKSDPDDYVVNKIFSMLWELLDRSCDSAFADRTSAAETSHLRIAGSEAIVVLTTYPRYMDQLSVPKFERLGFALQDPVFQVRSALARSLMKGLQTEQIHPRYYALLFVCAHEPEDGLIKQVKSFIQKRLSIMDVKHGESSVLDSSLVRLIHLLAHHPDFSIAFDDLNSFARYFQFFISCAATPDNVSFLYHIVQKIKLSKDMVANELSQNSYVLSDLACELIKMKCKEASWPLAAYEGHVSLQSKLYRTLPSGAVQTETMKKNYLPDAYVVKLKEDPIPKQGEKAKGEKVKGEKIKGEKRTRSGTTAANKKPKV